MYHKNLSSIYKRFILTHKSIHTTTSFEYITKPLIVTQLSSILQACSSPCFLQQGKQVHAQFTANGISNNGQLGAKILGMYVLCSSFVDAKNIFYKLDLSFTMPWNLMIRGFAMMGCFDFALLFYFKMLGCQVYPDKYTFPSVVKACGGLNNVKLGNLVHDTIRLMGFEVDVFVGSALVKLYAENGCIDKARCLFDKMSHRDSVLWNVMLNGYVKCGELDNAIRAFQEMRNSETKPNSVTFACLLSVCAAEAITGFGTQLHGLVVRSGLEFNSPVPNTLLAMYSKCRQLSYARKLFDLMPRTDLVTWNGMIAGYVQNGLMDEASHLFHEMISAGVKPDSITFASFLPSVTESLSLKQGKWRWHARFLTKAPQLML